MWMYRVRMFVYVGPPPRVYRHICETGDMYNIRPGSVWKFLGDNDVGSGDVWGIY